MKNFIKLMALATALYPLLFLPLFLSSCHLDDDLGDEPIVTLIISVEDSTTGTPLPGVHARFVTHAKDTLLDTTNATGQVEVVDLRSTEIQVKFSLEGYKTIDTLITVDSLDSNAVDVEVTKQLLIKMVSFTNAAKSIQVVLRNAARQSLTLGSVTYIDSSGDSIDVIDEDSNGVIHVPHLQLPDEYLKIQHPDYLGKYFSLATLDSGSNPVVTVTLLALNQSIAGNVAIQSIGGSILAYEGAKVVYVLSDSLSTPQRFTTTSDSNGYFQLDSLPLLPGELEYYESDSSLEPSVVLPLLEADLRLSTNVEDVVLDPVVEGAPILLALPLDSIDADEGIVFRFNQEVNPASINIVVNRVDQDPLWIGWSLSSDQKALHVVLNDSLPWAEGVHYHFSLSAQNVFGKPFVIPGSPGAIQGFFYVRKSISSVSRVVYPTQLRFAYFNSGNDTRVDSNHTSSSPFADSTSQLAVLKWNRPAVPDTAKLVDSLVIYYRDLNSRTDWVIWNTVPATLDSLVLRFSDRYQTYNEANLGKPVFPLISAVPNDTVIQVQIVPKEKNNPIDSLVTSLNITQGMGASIYLKYIDSSLVLTPNINGIDDTLAITFLYNLNQNNSYADFDTAGFTPSLRSNRDTNNIVATWEWTDSHSGQFRIQAASDTDVFPGKFWIDINPQGQLLGTTHKKPIWLRNKNRKINVDQN